MIQKLFITGDNEVEIMREDLPILQLEPVFQNAQLQLFNEIIHDSSALEVIILKDGMQFFGDVFLHKIYRTLKMYDEGYDKTFTYMQVSGIFSVYAEGNTYKRFYNNES